MKQWQNTEKNVKVIFSLVTLQNGVVFIKKSEKSKSISIPAMETFYDDIDTEISTHQDI